MGSRTCADSALIYVYSNAVGIDRGVSPSRSEWAGNPCGNQEPISESNWSGTLYLRQRYLLVLFCLPGGGWVCLVGNRHKHACPSPSYLSMFLLLHRAKSLPAKISCALLGGTTVKKGE